jgi:26S proteasome regulatory subunit N8
VFVIIDVRPGVVGIPTTAYIAVEEVEVEGKEIQRVFKHLPCSIEAEEAEEVGVEHLLRDINDPSTSNLALQIQRKVNGLTGLLGRLAEIRLYLERVNIIILISLSFLLLCCRGPAVASPFSHSSCPHRRCWRDVFL